MVREMRAEGFPEDESDEKTLERFKAASASDKTSDASGAVSVAASASASSTSAGAKSAPAPKLDSQNSDLWFLLGENVIFRCAAVIECVCFE